MSIDTNRDFNFPEVKIFFDRVNLANLVKSGNRVLEVGCRYGNIVKGLVKGYEAIPFGLDKSSDYDLNFAPCDMNHVKGDAIHLPYLDNTFDFVFSYMALRYVEDKLEAIKETHRVLKIGGTALLDLYSFPGNLEDSFMNPGLSTIVEKYPNEGQVIPDKYVFFDGPTYLYCYNAIIKKTSVKEIVFPKVISNPLFDVDSISNYSK